MKLNVYSKDTKHTLDILKGVFINSDVELVKDYNNGLADYSVKNPRIDDAVYPLESLQELFYYFKPHEVRVY